MKILKVALLSLLVTICAVAGTVTIMHFAGFDFGGKDADPTSINTGRNSDSNAVEDTDENTGLEMLFISGYDDDEDDYRFWQRAAVKPENSEFWHYFPVIPYDALAGEKVVLSVSSIGFQGWLSDPAHTPVDLFDVVIGDVNASVSFIMPETSVSIAALYDEIPDINYENQRDEVIHMMSMHEQGNAGGDGGLRPVQGTTIIMPPLIIGDFYNVQLSDPILRDPTWNLTWEFVFPTQLSFMSALETPLALGRGARVITNAVVPEPPTTPGAMGPHNFFVNIRVKGGEFDGDLIDRYNFSISFGRPDSPPEIQTPTLPDGMVDVDYNVPIITAFFPPHTPTKHSVWTWSLIEPTGSGIVSLPDGLELWVDPAATYNGVIRSRARPAGVEGLGPTTAGQECSFRIRMVASARTIIDHSDILNFPPEVNSEVYTIKIWDQPTITPPAYLDGMVGQPYNFGFPAIPAGAFTLAGNTDAISQYPLAWGWARGDDDFYGDLKIDTVGGIDSVAIHGIPDISREGQTYDITLQLKSTNLDLIIGETKPITRQVHIWARPVFKDWSSYNGKLPDGMVGPGVSAYFPQDKPPEPYPASSSVTWSIGSEPDEVYSGALIESDLRGLTNVQQITWHGAASSTTPLPTLPDTKLEYTDIAMPAESVIGSNLEITGQTTNNTEPKDHILPIGFTISHLNPNINNARTTADFTLRIWRRTYLSVIMKHPTIAEWEQPGTVSRSGVLDPKVYARAIIPGQWGTIESMLLGTNFIRWEVDMLNRLSERLTPESALTFWPGVGDNWELSAPGLVAMGRTHIRMPLPDDYTKIEDIPPRNVVIFGWHSEVPYVRGNLLPNGIENREYFRSVMITNGTPSVIGSGPLPQESWSIAGRADDTFPDGVSVMSNGIIGGTPTERGTFDFHVALTLPGTMRLTYGQPISTAIPGLLRAGTTVTPFSILIDEFKPIRGDFNGDGKLDLYDLIILSQFVNGTGVVKANAEFVMTERDGWRNTITPKSSPDSWPDGSDLTTLAEWFAIDQTYAVWKQSN